MREFIALCRQMTAGVARSDLIELPFIPEQAPNNPQAWARLWKSCAGRCHVTDTKGFFGLPKNRAMLFKVRE
jgi:hypothetical protein